MITIATAAAALSPPLNLRHHATSLRRKPTLATGELDLKHASASVVCVGWWRPKLGRSVKARLRELHIVHGETYALS